MTLMRSEHAGVVGICRGVTAAPQRNYVSCVRVCNDNAPRACVARGRPPQNPTTPAIRLSPDQADRDHAGHGGGHG
jgi:hypothetical protein